MLTVELEVDLHIVFQQGNIRKTTGEINPRCLFMAWSEEGSLWGFKSSMWEVVELHNGGPDGSGVSGRCHIASKRSRSETRHLRVAQRDCELSLTPDCGPMKTWCHLCSKAGHD